MNGYDGKKINEFLLFEISFSKVICSVKGESLFMTIILK